MEPEPKPVGPEPPVRPEMWVKVVEAHAAKTWIGIILATSAGISLVSVAVGAVWNTIANPEVTDLSANFMTLLGTSMGTLFGGLVGFISGQAFSKKNGHGEVIPESDMTLHVKDHTKPKEPPQP